MTGKIDVQGKSLLNALKEGVADSVTRYFAPVKAVWKTAAGLTYIDTSEWEDFRTALKQCKRSEDEFEVFIQVEPVSGAGIQPLRGKISIRNRATGAIKVYSTGHMSSWVAEFQRDLEAEHL